MNAPHAAHNDPALTQLTLHLSPGFCLACRHCWLASSPAPDDAKGILPTRLTARAVEQALHEALPLGLRAVRLSGSAAPGGDVLLHPEIDALLDRLESLELRVEVETSGAGLTPARAKRLARMPQCEVIIGLDGASAAAHDALHLPGDFETATGAVRMLAQLGLAARLVFSLLRGNVRQIPAAIRLAGELGAKSLRFVPAHTARLAYGHAPNRSNGHNGVNGHANGHANGHTNRGTGSLRGQTGPLNGCELASPARMGTAPLSARRVTGSLSSSAAASLGSYAPLRVEELIALGRKVERELAQNAPLPLIFDQPPAFRGLHHAGHVEGQGRCTILNSLSVLPGGWYALCGIASGLSSPRNGQRHAHNRPEVIFGKAGADSLRRIWHEHPTLRQLRESLPDRLEGVCERCLMKSACLGYCPAESFCATGDFRTPYWFCEAAERAGLFPASRLIENSW